MSALEPAPEALSQSDEEQEPQQTTQEALIETRSNRAALGSTSPKGVKGDPFQAMGKVGFVVLEQIGAPPPDEAIAELVAHHPVVFVSYSGSLDHAEAARSAGAIVVKMRGENETSPARARNAGFRQLRKTVKDIEFVQFLDGGNVISPSWLMMATAFLKRRPEVTAVEGITSRRASDATEESGLSALPISNQEVRITGNNVLVRVKSFVDIGGFRGDLILADIHDFCLRSRGRGRHIWRLETPMITGGKTAASAKGIARARANGFEYAYSASLHGASPENFRVPEVKRAVFWDGILPIITLIISTIVTTLVYYIFPFTTPIYAGLMVILFALLLYGVKIIWWTGRDDNGRKRSFLESAKDTVSHIPEFFGVANYYLWSRRQRAKA